MAIFQFIEGRSHRWPYAGFLASQAEGDRSVLRSLVGVMDHVSRPALYDRRVQGVKHELGLQIVAHRPADNAPREGVQHAARYRNPAQVGT